MTRPPLVAHALAAAIVAGAFALARWAPDAYAALLQEDRAPEWWTVGLFGVAGVARILAAVRRRRAFDFLVGLFCLFVAGEEISWGQRLLGYTPPDVFLAHNTQQEATLHNFADVFGQPKWMLALALAGYGLLLPLLGRAAPTRRLLERIGATAPAWELAPWFAAAVVLLAWYPLTFTGEWVELLAGLLFMASIGASSVALASTAAATLAASVVAAELGARRRPAPADLACARAEAASLLRDVLEGGVRADALEDAGSVHKRLRTAARDGYVDAERLSTYAGVACPAVKPDALAARRRYAIDPWGTAYWIRIGREDDDGRRRVVVYSFGPDRRRDSSPERTGGDDVGAAGVLEALEVAP